MRWKPKKRPEWRRFFALFPMKVEGVMVWMEWVDMKAVLIHGDYGHIFRLPRKDEEKDDRRK